MEKKQFIDGKQNSAILQEQEKCKKGLNESTHTKQQTKLKNYKGKIAHFLQNIFQTPCVQEAKKAAQTNQNSLHADTHGSNNQISLSSVEERRVWREDHKSG